MWFEKCEMRVYIFGRVIWEMWNVKFCVKRESQFSKHLPQAKDIFLHNLPSVIRITNLNHPFFSLLVPRPPIRSARAWLASVCLPIRTRSRVRSHKLVLLLLLLLGLRAGHRRPASAAASLAPWATHFGTVCWFQKSIANSKFTLDQRLNVSVNVNQYMCSAPSSPNLVAKGQKFPSHPR